LNSDSGSALYNSQPLFFAQFRFAFNHPEPSTFAMSVMYETIPEVNVFAARTPDADRFILGNFCSVCRNLVFCWRCWVAAVGGEVMNIGYARYRPWTRIRTWQMQVLRKAGCKKIFREKVSGASRERPIEL
jgi:hypothetical protein